MTQEQYELTHREIGNPLEQGALVHIAGPYGLLCIVFLRNHFDQAVKRLENSLKGYDVL